MQFQLAWARHGKMVCVMGVLSGMAWLAGRSVMGVLCGEWLVCKADG